jgi:hypothetical protein
MKSGLQSLMKCSGEVEDIFLIVVEVATDADQVPPLEFDNRYLDASQLPELLL